MGITSNVSRPSANLTNVDAPRKGVRWQDETMAWSAESRTWAETAEIMDNDTRPTPSMINVTKPS
jgi:hypothetical protein